MLEIIKQLALDAAEKGADFCVGTVTKAAPLTIRLEEGLELTEAFLVLTGRMFCRQRKRAVYRLRVAVGVHID